MNNMLMYRSWLETRWRFLIGLALLTISAASNVLFYPQIVELMPMVDEMEFEGAMSRRIAESVALSSTFKGYVWSQAISQNLIQFSILFAALLGVAGPLFQGQGRGVLFMLSLPASRDRLFVTRIGTGLIELLVLMLVPVLIISLVSPGIGEQFPIGSAIIHGLCLFVAASVFYSATILLSTLFEDVWRPLLIVCGVAAVMALLSRSMAPLSIFPIMNGESYFLSGNLPWLGLLVCILIAAGLLYSATRVFSRRDF
ncbi:MAG: hypothetical protein O2971_19580 [Proteobacteria bacterium]|nr:hypothetical protein [Pseudomonadota bacterium]